MRRLALAATCGALLGSPALAQTPLGTSFTYQGRVMEGGSPANGSYDFRFVLYDAPSGGTQVGPVVTREDVFVSTGLFTVGIDFGAVFGSQRRFLEVAVRPGASTGAYDIVQGRHDLTAAPAALFGASAPWSGVTGKPAGFADDVDNDSLAAMACSNGQVAKSTGSGWSCGTDLNTTYIQGPGVSITGNVISLAALGVSSTNLMDGAVTQPKLADNAVTTAKLADSSVNGSKLSFNSVALSNMTDNSVGTVEILANAVTSAKIAPGAVTATQIAAAAVGSAQLGPSAVQTNHIGGIQIVAGHIAPGQIVANHIAGNAVSSGQILNETLTANDIGPSAVGASEIAPNAVERNHLAGVELAIYQGPAGCANVVTFAPVCGTIQCNPFSFNNCDGVCALPGSIPCATTLRGYLLSVSIP